jgi:lipopolysaccharide transport system ATP-binding protein
MSFAIRVENLSKKYILRHQAGGRSRYVALRDVLAHKAKSLFQKNRVDAGREEFWALKDVSFEIQQGEAVGIIGRNGAGKSTLLKLLSRITKPTKGRIEIEGRVASLLEVGTGFHPELTGRENIFLNGAILGMHRAEIRKKFDEIVAFAEVEKFLDTPVKHFSSGMYMRLAFAVAAHLEPEILVVDEVLAVGDAAFQKKCLGKMQDVSRGGRTVLFVSHNMGAVTSLCRKGIWLDKGRVARVGQAREIVDQYLTNDSESQKTTIEIADIRRQNNYGQRLKIEKLEWLSGLPLQHGEKFTVRVHFQTYDDVHAVSVGVGFSNLEGGRLLSYDSDFQDGNRPDIGKKYKGYADITVGELPLAPGIYNFSVGCRSGDSFGLDYLPDVNQIEVIMGPRTPGYIVVPGAGVRLISEWAWNFCQPEASSIGA